MPLLAPETLCHLAKDVPQSQLRSSSKERKKINRELDEPRASYNIGGANSEKATERPQRHAELGPFSSFHRGSLAHLPLSVWEGRECLHKTLIGLHKPWVVRRTG